MNNTIEYPRVNKDLVEGGEVHICLESKEKSFDFRQFGFDFMIISIISLTLKAILALNIGQSYINLY